MNAPLGLYPCTVLHVRSTPIRNSFRYRSYLWLVDADALPRWPLPLRLLAQFRAADHLGDPQASIGENVRRFLSAEGIDLPDGRILMLSAARVFGYVFNPLSVFWCHDRSGALACVVAEVHNTYGERHCYLLRPDERGRARVDKQFYVSPFEPVSGEYRMSLPVPGPRLELTITLHRPDQAPFTAAVRGRRIAATPLTLLAIALRYPLAPLVAAARIRRQGIGLWLRGLRVVPRPEHDRQEAVQ